MKVQIWNNKGNRKMFVLDTTNMTLISPNDIKISGYVNDYKTGNVLTFHEEIPPLSGSEYIPPGSQAPHLGALILGGSRTQG